MRTPSLVVRLPTRALLTCLAALAVWGLFCARSGATDAPGPQGPRDTDLFAAAVARVHAGEPYYDVMGDELRARGYPTSSVFNWRLPTLTWLEAALPSLAWSRALVSLLGLAVACLWWWPRRREPPLVVLVTTAALVITLPLWAWVNPGAIVLHDL